MIRTDTPNKGWLRSAAEVAGILLAVVIAKTAVAEPFYVPSGSMEPTLLIGDQLLATKFPYGYSTASLPGPLGLPDSSRVLAALPERGDVVVFRGPGDRARFWVKRVIGRPGDRIAMRAGQLRINGEPAPLTPDGVGHVQSDDGSLIEAQRFVETLPGGRRHLIFRLVPDSALEEFPEVVVPAGHLFVMGDNRDNSADSRVPVRFGGVGPLPIGNLVGRVDALVGSWDFALKQQPFWSWPSGLRLARFFTRVQ